PTAPAPRSSFSLLHRLIGWTVGLVVVVVLVILGMPWFSYRLSHSSTEDAFVEAHIVNVAPEMVSRRLVRFLVQENDRVEQGEIVEEMEPVHYRDQVEQARGKLELAQAELERQKAGLTRLKNEVPLQIDIAQKTLAAALTEEERASDSLILTTD